MSELDSIRMTFEAAQMLEPFGFTLRAEMHSISIQHPKIGTLGVHSGAAAHAFARGVQAFSLISQPDDPEPAPPDPEPTERTPGLSAFDEAGKLVWDTYSVPFAPHAPTGPRNVRDGKFRDLIIESGSRAGIILYGTDTTTLDMRNCLLRPAQPGRWSWHAEGYSVLNPIVEDSEFIGAPSGSGDGHALYLMGAGDAVFRRIKCRDLPGQCIQLHWAHGDTGEPRGNTILFEDIDVARSGYGGMGGSALTVRGNRQIGTNVTFRRVKFDGEIPAFGSTNKQSKGAIACWSWASKDDPWTSGQNLYGTITVEDSQFRTLNPDRPVIKIEACDAVVLRNLKFQVEGTVGEGGIYLDARDGFPRTKSIIIADCTSNVPLPVFVRGERVGVVGELSGEIVR